MVLLAGSGTAVATEATADLSGLEERESPQLAASESLPELTGTWRLDLALATEVQAPLVGRTVLVNHQATLAKVNQTDTGYQISQVPCSIRTESERSLIETEFPDAFVANLPRKTYPLLVYRDGLGWRVEGDVPAQHLGYNPALTPDGRPPQTVDAPGVVDTDKDGHPGVTVIARAPLFGEVELFLSQTTTTVFRGRLEADGGIRGQAHLQDMEQWVIGASNRLFHRNPPVRPVSEGSSFTMTRVAKGTTCADLVAGR